MLGMFPVPISLPCNEGKDVGGAPGCTTGFSPLFHLHSASSIHRTQSMVEAQEAEASVQSGNINPGTRQQFGLLLIPWL